MGQGSGFTRVWERRARAKSAEEVVFGPFIGRRYAVESDRAVFDMVERLLRVGPRDVLLDVGCGPLARGEVYFGQRGGEVVGVDVSASALMRARRHIARHGVGARVHLVVADAVWLPFREGTFDRVLAVGVLSHLPDKRSVVASVRDMGRCLTEDGICYLNWWQNLYSFFGALIQVANRIAQLGRQERVQILAFKGLREIRALLHGAGLKIADVVYGSVIMFAYYPSPAFVQRAILKLFSVMDGFREHHPNASFLPYSFDLVVGKR